MSSVRFVPTSSSSHDDSPGRTSERRSSRRQTAAWSESLYGTALGQLARVGELHERGRRARYGHHPHTCGAALAHVADQALEARRIDRPREEIVLEQDEDVRLLDAPQHLREPGRPTDVRSDCHRPDGLIR